MYDWPALENDLFATLAAAPNGLDVYELASILGLNEQQVRHLVHRLRRTLGASDTANVIVRNQFGRYLYTLAGNSADVHDYNRTRMTDGLTRLESMLAVWKSIERGTDGRTTDGRAARHAVLYLERLIEDVKVELGLVP
jgi:hypothetical protein